MFLSRLAPLRPHFLGILLLSLLVWLLHSMVMPIDYGRDTGTYFLYYKDILRLYPDRPLCQLFRTPGTPLFFGLLFDCVGPVGVAATLWLAYAASLCLVFAVGASLRLWCGYAAWLCVALDVSHYEWFNRLGSESPQSILLVLWTAYAFFTFYSVRFRTWVCHATLIFLLVMVRPGNQVAALALLIPLLNTKRQWLERIRLAGGAIAVYLVLIAGYCSYNYMRYGDFRVARLGDAHLPFYRVFIQDSLVRPENGPASAELARLFTEHIATNPTMVAYGIDSTVFFETPTARMFSAIILAINEQYGWDQQYSLLRRVGIEAARAHPWQFWLGYFDQVRDVFCCPGPIRLRPASNIDASLEKVRNRRYSQYRDKGLPIPSEGELIPSVGSFLLAKPSNYPSSTATIFGIRHTASPWNVETARLSIPSVPGWDHVSTALHFFKTPNITLFVLLGIVGIAIASIFRPHTVDIRLPVLCLTQMINLLTTLMASVQLPFRYPFDPIFILFGCGAVAYLVNRKPPPLTTTPSTDSVSICT